MDSESTALPPKRRGRKPKSDVKLKAIELDEELIALIGQRNTGSPLQLLKAKLPESVMEELNVNIASLNQTGNTKISQDDYIQYALELANENLTVILKRHLSR